MLNKEKIFNIFKELGLKNTDNILIHSSLKNIGKIEGNAEALLDIICQYFNEGLVILPCHTWSFMNNDLDVLNLDEENSCVGMLPNIALRKGFLRSFHPTHSIVCYGKNADKYILNDNETSTPANPNGCFGKLKDINAKILFLGAKLSKNTFIHSIEEEFNVPDRLTNHIFKFYVKKNEVFKEYHVHKHYSTLNPHISENYMKLEKPMIELNIAKKFQFGDAESIIVDAKKSYDYVSKLLSVNLHIFDYPDEINEEYYKEKA